ncbi:hypothetical protein EDD22DRAFT_980308 [Suillus occidentalis]|nr:hypothetical protein EDD22DRAFT_980308 [Suillus occidentalis]
MCVFEQTGIFLSACQHGIVQTVTEMCHSGELTKYPLATMTIGSNIGCSLSKTVTASLIRDKAAQHKLLLSVNAFHGHAHNCNFTPYLETCEQIFTSSNAAASLIHHRLRS